MKHELPDFTHLSLGMFLNTNTHVIVQFLFGCGALLLSVFFDLLGIALLGAVFSMLAAIGLVVAVANLVGLVVRWRALRDHNFAVVGKVIDVTRSVDKPGLRLYKVEFPDPEGTRREGLVASEPWEKTPFAEGDSMKLLYDPRSPQNPTNYSAYELFQSPFPLPKMLRALLD